MKNIKIKTFVLSFFAMILVTGLMSCKKDDAETPSKSSHKVVFKLVASAGSNISTVVYGYNGQVTTATSLSGTTWTSPEITAPAGTISLNIAAGATGANANSTLKAQIFVDGEMKAEGNSSGTVLSASASFGL